MAEGALPRRVPRREERLRGEAALEPERDAELALRLRLRSASAAAAGSDGSTSSEGADAPARGRRAPGSSARREPLRAALAHSAATNFAGARLSANAGTSAAASSSARVFPPDWFSNASSRSAAARVSEKSRAGVRADRAYEAAESVPGRSLVAPSLSRR